MCVERERCGKVQRVDFSAICIKIYENMCVCMVYVLIRASQKWTCAIEAIRV